MNDFKDLKYSVHSMTGMWTDATVHVYCDAMPTARNQPFGSPRLPGKILLQMPAVEVSHGKTRTETAFHTWQALF